MKVKWQSKNILLFEVQGYLDLSCFFSFHLFHLPLLIQSLLISFILIRKVEEAKKTERLSFKKTIKRQYKKGCVLKKE